MTLIWDEKRYKGCYAAHLGFYICVCFWSTIVFVHNEKRVYASLSAYLCVYLYQHTVWDSWGLGYSLGFSAQV